MLIGHTGARIAHHRFDPLPHRGFITMHPAICTGRLMFLEGAFVEPERGIIEKFSALRAKNFSRPVTIMTVDRDHGFDRVPFPVHPAIFLCHVTFPEILPFLIYSIA